VGNLKFLRGNVITGDDIKTVAHDSSEELAKGVCPLETLP
jgi:hypothetical protein